MKEVKAPKRPLIYYYLIAMGIILLFNMLFVPMISHQSQVIEVDYGAFVRMAENQELGQVEVDETLNQLLFTDKDEKHIYKAGMISDPDLAQLLKDSGAKYGGQITIMGGIDSASIDRPDWNKELVEQEVRRVCKENGTKYYIPCLTQGLGISTFPGVYEAASEVIDKISKEVF